MSVIAGVGLRRDCPSDDIVTLVRQAERAAGVRITTLAAPAFKASEAGLAAAAVALGVSLKLVASPDLDAVSASCVTRSALALRTVGHASVAEGSALAAAGPGGVLLLPRIAGARATCALALSR